MNIQTLLEYIKRRKLNLVYWNGRENYGDYLSPFIVSKLSGCSIRQKDVAYLQKPWITCLKEFICHGRLFSHLSSKFFPFEKIYVCIGSIIGQGNRNSHYWGSGYLRGGGKKELCGTIYAVRGALSKKEILSCENCDDLKIIGDVPLGDPALLLPMFVPTEKVKKYKVGIIPHYQDFSFFKEKYGKKFFVINIETSNVISVTKQITSCECILSSSLHGLIVAHAYGIPALWIENKELTPGSGGFKFKDYFSSVGLSYEPFIDVQGILKSYDSISEIFLKNKEFTLPRVDLENLRNDLLRSAPFPIKKEFQRYYNC